MSEPNAQRVRPPAVAGYFYPANPAECQAEAQAFVDAGRAAAPPGHWIGGLAPHAGWMCSGAVAGLTIGAVNPRDVDVIVIFGAVHTPLRLSAGALDDHAAWQLPAGRMRIATDLAAKLAVTSPLFSIDARFHAREHAVEVELPLVRAAFGDVPVLPIEVPLIPEAGRIGRETARHLMEMGVRARYLASSDLTHYGPNYDFVPAGAGPAGREWAMDNDRRLLQLVTDMRDDAVVPEVQSRWNACGGGAIAAMLAACKQAGAGETRLLAHTNSCEVLKERGGDNAVGYAAVVVGSFAA